MKCGVCKYESRGDFCPICGSALTLAALRLKKEEEKKIKYSLLLELAHKSNDLETLKNIKEMLENLE